MVQLKHIIHYYRIKGLGITTYCRVNAYHDCMFIYIGKKTSPFCVAFSYDYDTPAEIKLRGVESDKQSNIGNNRERLEKAAIRYIRLALYTIKRWFPQVEKICIDDEYKLICKNSFVPLMLSLDYVITYGKSWYEFYFNATIDRLTDSEQGKQYITEYYDSLEIFTQPHKDGYNYLVDFISCIERFEEQFRASITPRDFIQRVRGHLGDQYCEEGAKILMAFINKYLRFYMTPRWKILMKDVEEVSDFERVEVTEAEVTQKYRNQTRSRKRMARYQFTHAPDRYQYSLWD